MANGKTRGRFGSDYALHRQRFERACGATVSPHYRHSKRSCGRGSRFLLQDWVARADAKYQLLTGDVVFARTGATTGKSFLVDQPPEAVFASYLIRLRLVNGILLPKFVSYFFQTDYYWESIRAGSSGSAQGGFNASKLATLSIPVPSIPEQQRIIGILDEAFEGIATAKADAEKNLRNARALFESHLQSVFNKRGEGMENGEAVRASVR